MAKKEKKFLVRVFIDDPYFWGLTPDFEEKFSSLKAARRFASRFLYTEILKKFSLTAYSQGELQQIGTIRAKNLEEAEKLASIIIKSYSVDKRWVEEV